MNIETELKQIDSKYFKQAQWILSHIQGINDLEEQKCIFLHLLKNAKFESELYKLIQSFLNRLENEIEMYNIINFFENK